MLNDKNFIFLALRKIFMYHLFVKGRCDRIS